MLFLSIVLIGSLALLLPASTEAHKKVIIHIPLEVHEKHHTHTVYKHVFHKDDHKHGWDSHSGSGSIKSGWKSEPWRKEKWSPIAESSVKDSHWHSSNKNPHRISSYIPNYNYEKKYEDLFKNELGNNHRHRGSRHSEFDSFENDDDSLEFDDRKNHKLAIAKVIKHTVYHDH